MTTNSDIKWATQLCVQKFVQANNKETALLLVDSPHKGPVMQKVFPCHDVLMILEATKRWFYQRENLQTIPI